MLETNRCNTHRDAGKKYWSVTVICTVGNQANTAANEANIGSLLLHAQSWLLSQCCCY